MTDSGKLARLDPEAALEMREYLRELLGRPQELEQLARALAIKAKESVGVYVTMFPNRTMICFTLTI